MSEIIRKRGVPEDALKSDYSGNAFCATCTCMGTELKPVFTIALRCVHVLGEGGRMSSRLKSRLCQQKWVA